MLGAERATPGRNGSAQQTVPPSLHPTRCGICSSAAPEALTLSLLPGERPTHPRACQPPLHSPAASHPCARRPPACCCTCSGSRTAASGGRREAPQVVEVATFQLASTSSSPPSSSPRPAVSVPPCAGLPRCAAMPAPRGPIRSGNCSVIIPPSN